MAYATVEQMRARLGSAAYAALTDRARLSDPIADDAVGAELVVAAAALIDQRIAARYAVPVDVSAQPVTAAWLRDCCLTIATYQGWLRHPLRSRQVETVQADYQVFEQRLADIAAGKESLPAAGPLPGPTATGAAAQVVGHARTMTEDGMRGLL